jgi:hypothetical protein
MQSGDRPNMLDRSGDFRAIAPAPESLMISVDFPPIRDAYDMPTRHRIKHASDMRATLTALDRMMICGHCAGTVCSTVAPPVTPASAPLP